jgi:hypothetical protein
MYIHTSAKQAPGFKAREERQMLELCGNAARQMIKPGTYRAMNPRALNKKNKKILPVFWKHNLKAYTAAVLFTECFQRCFIPQVKHYLEKGRLF